MSKKIPANKMDEIDQQQQEEIDHLRGLIRFMVYVIFFFCVVNAGTVLMVSRDTQRAVEDVRGIVSEFVGAE